MCRAASSSSVRQSTSLSGIAGTASTPPAPYSSPARVWKAVENILLSVAELADALGVSESTVYRWTSRGELPTVRLGGRIRFSPEAIGLAIAAQYQKESA